MTPKSVTFTRRQVEYINKQFPEVVGGPATPNEELRYRQGQRSVVLFLRDHADVQEVAHGVPE